MSDHAPGTVPRAYVLRLRSGLYLTATGTLTVDRRQAVALPIAWAVNAQQARYGHEMWGLSIEEVGKRDRRRVHANPVDVLNALHAQRSLYRGHQARQRQQEAERLAAHYRRLAAELEVRHQLAPAVNRTRRIQLED